MAITLDGTDGVTTTGLTSNGIDDNATSTAITIDASGHVGIGTTTPNAAYALDVVGNIRATNSAGSTIIANRTSNPGSFELQYSGTQTAQFSAVSGGGVSTYVGSTPTEAMRIDASGNVGVDRGQKIQWYDGTIGSGNVNAAIEGTGDPALKLYTRQGGTSTLTERMRIDSNGNVGVGTTPSGWGGAFDAIDVGPYGSFSADNDTTFITNNAYFNGTNWIYKNSNLAGRYRQQQGLHVWDTAASGTAGGTLTFLEAMRIDSAGQLLFNCTTNSQTSGEGVKFVGNGRMYTVSSYSNSLQENLTMYSTGASAFRFYVDWGGTIHATSTSISGISDERLKENIVDLETGLTEVMSLKPRRFDWKDDDKKNVAGFVAQEVETVLPDLVDQFKHNTLEDAKGVRVGDMIPTLVKAIQEQQAIIEDLKSRLSAVEAN